MLEIFAGYAAQALVNAEAFGQVRRQQQELHHRLESQRRLLEVNERLLATLDPGGMLEMIADSLKAVVAYDSLTIYRVDRAAWVRRAVVARDRFAEVILSHEGPLDAGITGWAIRNGEAVLANDAHLDPRAMQIPGTPEEPESMIVCPLLDRRARSSARSTWPHGRRGVPLLARRVRAGPAVRRPGLDRPAQRRDARRGRHPGRARLPHRPPQPRRVPARARRAPRARRPVRAPHARSRRLQGLQRRARPPGGRRAAPPGRRRDAGVAPRGRPRLPLRRRRVRDPAATRGRPGAREVAERVRAAVARLTETSGPRVTVSVGIARFPEDARDKDGLVAAADRALYLAKPPTARACPATTRPATCTSPPSTRRRSSCSSASSRASCSPRSWSGPPASWASSTGSCTSSRVRTARTASSTSWPAWASGCSRATRATACHAAPASAGRSSAPGGPSSSMTTPSTRHARPTCRATASGRSARCPSRPATRCWASSASRRATPTRPFSEREVEALARFGQLASIALDNARLFERAQTEVRRRAHAALHDPLTGLPNRTLLLNRLAEQLEAPRPSAAGGARPGAGSR